MLTIHSCQFVICLIPVDYQTCIFVSYFRPRSCNISFVIKTRYLRGRPAHCFGYWLPGTVYTLYLIFADLVSLCILVKGALLWFDLLGEGCWATSVGILTQLSSTTCFSGCSSFCSPFCGVLSLQSTRQSDHMHRCTTLWSDGISIKLKIGTNTLKYKNEMASESHPQWFGGLKTIWDVKMH